MIVFDQASRHRSVDSVDRAKLALNSGRYDGFLFYVII